MLDMKSGLTYEEYLKTGTEEDKKMINEFFNRVSADKEKIKEVNKIDKDVDIAVFSITRCKDAASAIPFLIKLTEENENIKIRFWHREGNEELLEKLTGAKRVPSMIRLENGNPTRMYVEFPKVVDEEIKRNLEEKESIVNDLRSNKYDQEIEKEIVNILL